MIRGTLAYGGSDLNVNQPPVRILIHTGRDAYDR